MIIQMYNDIILIRRAVMKRRSTRHISEITAITS